MRVKNGTPITLKCHNDFVKWEYKYCDSNFYGLLCDNGKWQKMNKTRGRIHIEAVAEKHNGIYRCYQDDKLLKVFIVDVVHPAYNGPPPQVAPLKTSNVSGQINMKFTIQCNVTSEEPPTIIWFKSCYGRKCDFKFNDVCYCHINTSISYHSIRNTYLSKFMIFNARDVDSGQYVCLAVNQYGGGFQNATIVVPSNKVEENESFSLLFLIPLMLILAPVVLWLCYCKRRKKKSVVIVDQQKQLIRPVVRINEII
nr:myoblast growth factor receptor egl-15 isoform X2 [Leptinotarsa decemlineata]